MEQRGLARFAWAVLALNLAVILWGAWVRASGSGAGCGQHWPLCDGQVVPRAPSAAQRIEFVHRATSGLALVAIVALAVAVYRVRPPLFAARAAARWSVVFVFVEAAIGAKLVLSGLVADNASLARAVVLPLHLVNTFLLLGALTLTARFAAGDGLPAPRGRGREALPWLGTLLLLAFAGASGGVAALGDTLFPARTLGEAVAQDFDPAAHALLRLRVAHPVFAALAAVAVLVLCFRMSETRTGLRWRRAAGALALTQIALGLANLALLAPVPLQLAHLLLADLLWIATVVAAMETFSAPSTAS